jgi:glutamine amidotransferase-like uncharacterized protein
VRVAVYVDKGTSANLDQLFNALAEEPRFQVERVRVEDVLAGKLQGFDVLIQPGGSGGGQGKALGKEGRERIRTFVRNGGGYLGICAGAYLATCDYTWSLNILDAVVLDKAHWARGNGPVDIASTDKGQSILGLPVKSASILYYQGPLLAPANRPEVADFDRLAAFETEIALKGAPTGVMKGTTAIASGAFGKGRVLCFSPHPEKTAEMHGVLHRGVLWSAGRSTK